MNTEAPIRTLNEYQRQAAMTAGNELPHEGRAAIWALGICGEGGEVAELIKKWLGHGHELDRERIKKELGDVLWYIAVMTEEMGFTLEEVAAANIAKLRARYGERFSEQRSRERAPGDV